MVRFISAPILYCMVSTVLVPISAEAQDFKRSLWLHSALAQATETRQAPFSVSLMTPASMLKDGAILYDHKSYGLDRSVRLRPFVAVQHDTYGGTLNFGARFGSWDRSDLEGVELSFLRQF
ncbi:hypothetical protein OAD55_06635 [Planktomarina temperata]|nr:hypothetical protein [Planktomarina temperata]